MYYNDKKYFLAIQDYRKGNNTSVISILKMLAKKNLTKFDNDINGFITEVQSIAKKNRDSVVIAYTKEVGNKISLIDGNSHGKTSAYENVLETETECKVALKKALENDEFNVVINNIVQFIKENKNFHTAVVILELIHNINYKSDIFTKEEVAMLFIEKMFKVIVNDVKPSVSGTLVKKYSSSWSNFNSQDFIYYHSIVRLYTKQYGINDTLKPYFNSKVLEKNTNVIKMNKNNFPYKLVMKKQYRYYYDEKREAVVVLWIENISYDGTGYKVTIGKNSTEGNCSIGEFDIIINGNKKTYDPKDGKSVFVKSKISSKISFVYKWDSTLSNCTLKSHININTEIVQGQYYVVIE